MLRLQENTSFPAGSISCHSTYLISWSSVCCWSCGELNFHQNFTSISVPGCDVGVERHSVLNSHNCEINKKAQRHELRKEDQPCFSWCDSLHCHKHHAVQDTQWAAAARCADHHLLWYLVQRWSYPPTLLHGCVKNSSLSKVYTRTSISYKASAEIPIILSSIMPLRGCTNSTTFDWKKRNF